MDFAAIVEANLDAPGNTNGTAGPGNPSSAEVTSIGEASREGVFARGAVGLSVSVGVVLSTCAPGDCVLGAGASMWVRASSDSVEVEVFVRNNAASNASAGASQRELQILQSL